MSNLTVKLHYIQLHGNPAEHGWTTACHSAKVANEQFDSKSLQLHDNPAVHGCMATQLHPTSVGATQTIMSVLSPFLIG